jgi:hypothetical protein
VVEDRQGDQQFNRTQRHAGRRWVMSTTTGIPAVWAVPPRLNDVRERSRALPGFALVFPVPVGLVSKSVSLPGVGLDRLQFRPDTIRARRVRQGRPLPGQWWPSVSDLAVSDSSRGG